MEHFYASISYGGTVLWKLMPRIKEEYAKVEEERKKALGIEDEYVVPIVEQKSQPKKSKSTTICYQRWTVS